jgi:hypothetical protein
MIDHVWDASVNQTITMIEAKINQSESLAGKNQPMTDRVWDAGVNQTSKRKSTNQKAWPRESNIEAKINQ